MTDLPPDDLDKRTGQYVFIRDEIKKLEAKHKEELKPLKDMLLELEQKISGYLTAHNVDALKTAHGTCYRSTRWSASLADPEVFMNYVIQSERWELLDRRANVTAVKDYVASTKSLPPGCNLTSVQTLGVRRKGNGEATE